MLSPENRTLLFESLRPRAGYELDHALITTYTLDLTALLAVPLAITFQAWEGEGEEPAHPLAVLDALRSNADRVTVIGQAGGIAVPRAQRNVFALVEDAVRSVGSPRGGVFHPKVWVLRFVPLDDDEPVTYRLVVASRNLTFDRSWDLALALDGTVGKSVGETEVGGFVRDLRGLVGETDRPLDPERDAKLEAIGAELDRVAWDAPSGMRIEGFHPIGLGTETDPLAAINAPALVVSPFLGAGLFSRLGVLDGDGSVLVSNQEELDFLDGVSRSPFTSVKVLTGLIEDGLTDLEGDSTGGSEAGRDPGLRGLHAKLFVSEAGGRPRMLVGSANATGAAFEQNVEFMVELSGRRKEIGIEAIVGADGQLADLLDDFRPADEPASTDEERMAERIADDAIRALALGGASLVAEAGDEEGEWSLSLLPGDTAELGGVEMVAWPVTLNEGRALEVGGDPLSWDGLTASQITAFVAVSAVARSGAAKVEKRAALLLKLVGGPADRASRVVREILDSPERLMRYLALLLSDLDADPSAADRLLGELGGSDSDSESRTIEDAFPLFEGLVRALDRDPAKLDRVAALIADLSAADGDGSLIPPEFEALWAPVAEAREQLRGRAR